MKTIPHGSPNSRSRELSMGSLGQAEEIYKALILSCWAIETGQVSKERFPTSTKAVEQGERDGARYLCLSKQAQTGQMLSHGGICIGWGGILDSDSKRKRRRTAQRGYLAMRPVMMGSFPFQRIPMQRLHSEKRAQIGTLELDTEL
jgi:hypothetical protein